jgi:type II secretion system protein G
LLMKMRHQMKKGRNQKGFTLVELMVVVVIIGILSAIAVPVYNNVTEKAEASACKANIRTLEGALEAYKAVNDEYPDDLSDLETEYIKDVPDCPTKADSDGDAGYTYSSKTGDVTCKTHPQVVSEDETTT